jgi:hypothetical protein
MTYKDAIQAAREKAMLYRVCYIVYACEGHWWNRQRYNYCLLDKLYDRKMVALIQPDGRIH